MSIHDKKLGNRPKAWTTDINTGLDDTAESRV
ncbi:uncharacterized protein G2W53_003161 [Senna tora]|uniref:Uncharacterized protein n=1 Tax=Senna tora TaxID=362788 RepID=A0A834X8G7_9FABA|nr:uncharacterized protein G2W53_003161 [Senna tora]